MRGCWFKCVLIKFLQSEKYCIENITTKNKIETKVIQSFKLFHIPVIMQKLSGNGGHIPVDFAEFEQIWNGKYLYLNYLSLKMLKNLVNFFQNGNKFNYCSSIWHKSYLLVLHCLKGLINNLYSLTWEVMENWLTFMLHINPNPQQ